MNIEKARAVLKDLEAQKKEAEDKFNLLIGAVQGAELVLKALEELTLVEPINKEEPEKKKAKK